MTNEFLGLCRIKGNIALCVYTRSFNAISNSFNRKTTGLQ